MISKKKILKNSKIKIKRSKLNKKQNQKTNIIGNVKDAIQIIVYLIIDANHVIFKMIRLMIGTSNYLSLNLLGEIKSLICSHLPL